MSRKSKRRNAHRGTSRYAARSQVSAERSLPPRTSTLRARPSVSSAVEAAITPATRARMPALVSIRDLWLAHRRTVCALAGAALLIRAAMLWAFNQTPYFEMLNIDMKSYHAMALEIRGGQWLPNGPFYQAPLYAYFLAFLYKCFGTSLWVPRITNLVLGTANIVLLYALGVRLFSRPVGLGAAVLLLLFGPLLLEETGVIKTSLIIFCLLLSLALVLRHAREGTRSGMVASGMFLGITAAGAGQLLVAIPVLAVTIGSRWWNPSNALRSRFAAWFLAGCLIPLAPVIGWNTYWGGGLLLTSADAGLNLYMGNNPRSTGLPARPPGLRDIPEYEPGDARRIAEKETGRPLSMAEVSRYWSGRALSYMADNPASFLSGLARKFVVLWNAYELPDNYHYSFIRNRFMRMLWVFPTFALIGPLALLGLIVHGRRWRELLPLYGVCTVYLAILLLFYVRGRYRLAAVPLLMLFAAAGAAWLLRAWREQHWKAMGLGVVLFASAAVFVNQTYTEPPHHGWPAITFGGTTWFDDEYAKLADWFEQRGRDADLVRALGYVDEGLQLSHDPMRVGSLHFRRGVLSGTLGRRLVGSGVRAEAEARLRDAEAAFEKCLSLGYRARDAQANLNVARRSLDTLRTRP